MKGFCVVSTVLAVVPEPVVVAAVVVLVPPVLPQAQIPSVIVAANISDITFFIFSP
jgi:hypothetical protein